ncbi:ribosome biogenesis protein SLX9-domain-containing protein [Lipomyces oligophaga]|uniref:ribosome biogenesis protein SLX9-domain-containing protein n=1 Tax=Lipomyces oligophaga TaxID=45792 RepID=UPI0034CDD76F
MVPKRQSVDGILAYRHAVRAHQNELKLEAARQTIERASADASRSKNLSTRLLADAKISKTRSRGIVKARVIANRRAGNSKRPTGLMVKANRRPNVVMPSSLPRGNTGSSYILSETEKLGGSNFQNLNKEIPVEMLSRSARKRRNRVKREKLAGSTMSDLLDALPTNEYEIPIKPDEDQVMDGTPEGVRAHKSRIPDSLLTKTRTKPVSSKANERSVRQEIDRFGKVMSDQNFRENPFEVLRGFIQQRL